MAGWMDKWGNDGRGELVTPPKGQNVSGRVLSNLTNVDKWLENNISEGKRSTRYPEVLILFAFISGHVSRGVHIRIDNHLHLFVRRRFSFFSLIFLHRPGSSLIVVLSNQSLWVCRPVSGSTWFLHSWIFACLSPFVIDIKPTHNFSLPCTRMTLILLTVFFYFTRVLYLFFSFCLSARIYMCQTRFLWSGGLATFLTRGFCPGYVFRFCGLTKLCNFSKGFICPIHISDILWFANLRKQNCIRLVILVWNRNTFWKVIGCKIVLFSFIIFFFTVYIQYTHIKRLYAYCLKFVSLNLVYCYTLS